MCYNTNTTLDDIKFNFLEDLINVCSYYNYTMYQNKILLIARGQNYS